MEEEHDEEFNDNKEEQEQEEEYNKVKEKVGKRKKRSTGTRRCTRTRKGMRTPRRRSRKTPNTTKARTTISSPDNSSRLRSTAVYLTCMKFFDILVYMLAAFAFLYRSECAKPYLKQKQLRRK